ncbi:MAG: flippase [Parabacteroides gordonii]|nr:flippase [Parabacteroides gordonii]
MTSSIKRNFALNLVNTISGLLFPLVTFPYASRILLADGIGQVQFFQGIIGYISLCTALGIPLYAIREIARVRNDKTLCSKTAIEILLLHSVLTLAGYAVVYVLVATVAKIQVDIPLFLLQSINLFFTAIGAVWFYQGIEDFKYITIRAIIIRVFSLICLFVFIKDKSDLFYYAAISVTAEVGSNLFNFIRLRKYIDIDQLHLKELRPLRHLRSALKIFAMNLVISIYVNLDSVMLGFMKNEAAVGYYAASTRITKSILGIVQSLGTVLLPSLTNLISENRMDEFRLLANKAMNFTLATSLPLTIGLIFTAKPLIHLFAGMDLNLLY